MSRARGHGVWYCVVWMLCGRRPVHVPLIVGSSRRLVVMTAMMAAGILVLVVVTVLSIQDVIVLRRLVGNNKMKNKNKNICLM